MAIGRPPIFEKPEDLQELIEEYFQLTNFSEITITGLAYYLGFESRQSFYDYEERGDFSYIIKRSRLFIESAYERKLSGKEVGGAIFALKNMGWKDKTEVKHEGDPEAPVIFKLDDRFRTKGS